ncbi:unnamed protein product, partial [Pelagomonas calceolata]
GGDDGAVGLAARGERHDGRGRAAAEESRLPRHIAQRDEARVARLVADAQRADVAAPEREARGPRRRPARHRHALGRAEDVLEREGAALEAPRARGCRDAAAQVDDVDVRLCYGERDGAAGAAPGRHLRGHRALSYCHSGRQHGRFFRAGRRDAAARVAARRRRRREAERHARRRDVLVVRRERQLAQDEDVARAAPDEQRARVVGGAAAPRGQEPELLAARRRRPGRRRRYWCEAVGDRVVLHVHCLRALAMMPRAPKDLVLFACLVSYKPLARFYFESFVAVFLLWASSRCVGLKGSLLRTRAGCVTVSARQSEFATRCVLVPALGSRSTRPGLGSEAPEVA